MATNLKASVSPSRIGADRALRFAGEFNRICSRDSRRSTTTVSSPNFSSFRPSAAAGLCSLNPANHSRNSSPPCSVPYPSDSTTRAEFTGNSLVTRVTWTRIALALGRASIPDNSCLSCASSSATTSTYSVKPRLLPPTPITGTG